MPLCRNEYITELGKLEAAKDDMIGGGQPVELAVELLRCKCKSFRMCGWIQYEGTADPNTRVAGGGAAQVCCGADLLVRLSAAAF